MLFTHLPSAANTFAGTLFLLLALFEPGATQAQVRKQGKDQRFPLAAPTILWNKAGSDRVLIGLLPTGAEVVVESRKKTVWLIRWEDETGVIDAPSVSGRSAIQAQSLANGAAFVRYTSTSERRPKPGDVLFFNVQLRHRDSVIYASRAASPDPPYIQIPPEESPNPSPSPMEEALLQSAEGDSLTLVIPVDPAARTAGFEDMRFLLYDVTVLEVLSAEQYEAREAQRQETYSAKAGEVQDLLAEFAEAYRNGELDGQLERMGSGLQFLILEPGGGPQVEFGDQVLVHYSGLLTDGRPFDNSFERGRPFAFPIGQGRVIAGWEEGIALLREGSRALLFVPPGLAYGPAGAPPDIPPNAELIFYVEVVKTGR